MVSPILQTKLFIPNNPSTLVARPRLVNQIDIGIKAGHKLTLLAAPAGYGKTTVATTWVHQNQRRTAWLSLDKSDNETATFWALLIAAIRSVIPNFGESIFTVLANIPPPPIDSILPVFVNELVRLKTPLVLVLDDYHFIANQEIHDSISFLLDHQPPQFHLILMTRADPPLSTSNLRAQQSLTEIRVNDLRFTQDEAQLFLNEVMGLELTAEEIQKLEIRTEGWGVGLILAAQSLQGRKDKDEFIRNFSGSQHYVLEYLIEEVLDRQPEEIRSFLLLTSIFDKFCGPLCDAVIGKDNSEEIIHQLGKGSLFIIPLDQEHTWYRYHHLFADLLSNLLQKEFAKEEILELYQRASLWYQSIGDTEKAIEFALNAEEFKGAAVLIEQIFDKIIARGHVRTLLEWFKAIPEEIIKTLPHLRIYHAWALSMGGQHRKAAQILIEVKSALAAHLDTPENLTLYGEASAHLAGIIMYTNDSRRVIQEAQEALAYLPERCLVSRARVFIALGTAHAYSDDLKLATQNYHEASDLAIKAGNPFLAAIAIEMLAGLQIYHVGCMENAIGKLEQILELGNIGEGHYQIFTGTAQILLAEINIERNNLDTAEKLLENGITLIQQGGIRYSLTYANCTKARLKIAQGDIAGAVEALRRANSAAAASPLMHILIHNQACQMKSAVYIGNIETASCWAEDDPAVMNYRIPENLPNYLSEVRQIALARVFLSQGNPEKTLAAIDNIYTQAEAAGRMRHVIEICLLRAIALQELGEFENALISFSKSLALAKPQKLVRLFLEAGAQITDLLKMAKKNKVLGDYAGMLLDTFNSRQPGSKGNAAAVLHQEGLIEPLTEREMEVMRLMCEGHSNQVIADKLIVSVNTVKKHTNNIYGKLGVKSRTQAVLQAYKLSLV